MEFIIGIFVSFFMIQICYIVLAHYLINVKSGKSRWELLLSMHIFIKKKVLWSAYVFCVILRVYKTEKNGVTWVHSEDCVPSTALQLVSISASFFNVPSVSFTTHVVNASTFLYGLWMETSQNQPQLDISLNFECKVDLIVSCELVPNKRCFFLILGQIHHGYGSCYRELLMLAYISPHSCGFVSPQSDF